MSALESLLDSTLLICIEELFLFAATNICNVRDDTMTRPITVHTPVRDSEL